MRVHQLVATLAPRDAVSNEARLIEAELRARGVETAIYAEQAVREAEALARPLGALAVADDDVVLLHYSIWSAVAERALALPGRLVVRYHNVTPPEWFAGLNEEVAELCRQGRAGVRRVAPHAALGLAPSAFSCADLIDAGFAHTAVVPFAMPERPLATPGEPADPPEILTVGRLVPNKRIDLLLRAFACYQRACEPTARLELVGTDEGFAPYGRGLRQLAADLRLRGVAFRSALSDAALTERYHAAAVFLTTSEHEGFCVPVVEAMQAGVPVLARAFAALPETVGEGGLVVATADPAELAELLDRLCRDAALRACIRAGQGRQLARLDLAGSRARLVELVLGAAS